MERNELEAAEALAGLAHSSIMVKEEEKGDRVDGDDRKMTQHLCSAFHVPQHEDDDGGTVVRMQQEEGQIDEKKAESSIQVKLDDEQRRRQQHQHEHQQQLCCSICYSTMLAAGGRKSRQPLTETEKEARRMRRVLANRESARQSLQRRQTVFEELTRKASDLGVENEKLKREKDLVAREHNSLKSTNDSLKEQMAQMMPTEARQIEEVAKRMHTEECHASASTTTPFFPYDQPSLIPLQWRSIIQPLEAAILQCRSEKDNANPSVFSMTDTWRPDLFMNVLPLPCFFPLHSPPNATPPHSSNAIDKQEDTHLSNQCSYAGSLCRSSLPLKIIRENYSSSPTILTDDHHHSGFEMATGRRHKSEGTHPNRIVLMPTPLNCFGPSSRSAGGGLNVTLQQEESSEEPVFPVTGHAANPVSEENREPTTHSSRESVDAGSTARARKRRKELMKLKANQAGHQSPTN